MSKFRRFDIVERSPSYFLQETSFFSPPKTLSLNPFFTSFPIVEDELDHALDLLDFSHPSPFSFDEFDTVTDLIQVEKTPFRTSSRRISRRVGLGELYLQNVCDRVSDLEIGLERLLREEKARKKKIGERKYTWTAEIESPEKGRKYKWTAEIKDGKDEKKGLERSYKWTAQIKGKGGENLPAERTYTFEVSNADGSSKSEKETDKKKKKKGEKVKEKGKSVGPTTRIVEIEEPSGHGGIVLRQVSVILFH